MLRIALREPKAGPWGVYQIQTETLPTGKTDQDRRSQLVLEAKKARPVLPVFRDRQVRPV
jgi:hypothetical protein